MTCSVVAIRIPNQARRIDADAAVTPDIHAIGARARVEFGAVARQSNGRSAQ